MSQARGPVYLPRPGRVLQYVEARLHAPQMPRDDVERLLTSYDLQVIAAPENLPLGWRGHSLVVRTNAGKKVLRRYRESWPEKTIAYEHAILRALEEAGFPAPRLVGTRNDRTIVRQDGAFFALFDYLEGKNYAGCVMLPAQRRQLLKIAGETLARLHCQLADFLPQGEHHLGFSSETGLRQRDLDWHLQQLPALSQKVDELIDPQAREEARWLAQNSKAIGCRLQRLEEKLASAPLPRTVIHGDYGIHNLHFQIAPAGVPRAHLTAAVVDFELARREWRLLDLVGVISRLGLQAVKTFVRAYQAACAENLTIGDEEWRRLPEVWQHYRLRGAIQYWHNYLQQGDVQRMAKARQRVEEADWARQHRPELWDLAQPEDAGSHGRPIRVMMVVRLFYPWIGGTERQAHKLANELMDGETSVELVTGWWYRGTPRREVIDGIPVYRNFTLWHSLDIKGLRKFSGYLYMLTLLIYLWRRRKDYDVIHVHGLNYHAFAAVLAGRWFKRKVMVKLANSGVASDVKKMRQDRQLPLAHLMLPSALQADCFVALNQKVVRELSAVGVPRQKIVSLPNGVETNEIKPKREYRLHDPARIVYVGRLHKQKGLNTLLRAFCHVQEALGEGNACLRLVGDGPLGRSLADLAQQLGVGAAVEFAGLRDDVVAQLEEADIFVLPSRAEGLSNALLEAMSAGLPVIVSDIPGNRDVIEHGANGLFFCADDAGSLAESLIYVLGRPDLRQQLGAAARRTVVGRYSLNAVAGRYARLYGELIHGEQKAGTPQELQEEQQYEAS
ncbi:MAG TPA: glycosyltransferase [Candidatus Binatia bacterium]|nr:glycosyltransferase [Candidatus Binatia bacterium]